MIDTPEGANIPAADESLEAQLLAAAVPTAAAPEAAAGARPQVLSRPQPGQQVTVELIPGQPIEITFDFPAAQISRGEGTLVFEFPDGGKLIVHGWDAAVAAGPELTVKLPDEAQATIAELKDMFDAIAVAPAAGPSGASGGPGNTGAAFTPYDAGNIGAGLNDLGPLGFGELVYQVPEAQPQPTDLLTLGALTSSPIDGGPSGGPPVASITGATVTEGQIAQFLVTLSGPSTSVVTISYSFANGSAQAPADFTGVTGTLVFQPGQLTQAIDVPTVADGTFEGQENFTVTLGDADGAVVVDPTATGVINDGDQQPTIVINNVVVNEGGQAVFTITLSGPSATPITVDFNTADGTATSPADFGAASGTVTFAPGVTTQTIAVSTVADGVTEDNETFVVNLINPTGATIADPQGTGTIIDSGATPPVITIDDVTVTEGGTAVFTVSLSGPSATPVTVNFSSTDGSASDPADYNGSSGTITFAPGVTTQTITIPTVADAIVEGTENFFIDLFDATGATIADDQGQGTIIEPVSEPVTLSIDDVSVLEGNTAVFTVSLSAASATPVTVSYGSTDGSAVSPGDFGAVSGTVTFAPGQTTQTIVVGTVGDDIFEGTESYTINLSNAAGATIADGEGLGTIIDDEAAPTITINDVTVFEGDTAIFTVTLSGPSATPVTVNYGSTDGSAVDPDDYGAVSGTITFAPGVTTQVIVVGTEEDQSLENTENFFINLSGATGAAIADDQGIGTIVDDEAGLQIIINDVTVTEGNVAVFTVTLSGATSLPVTVDFSTSDGTAGAPGDYTGGGGTITFIPGGALTQTISVPTTEDQLPEGSESFFVNLSNAANATIADGQGIGTILDDDPLPGLVIDDVVVTEGGIATFTVSLSGPSGLPVTATFTTADGTALAGSDLDYLATTGTITFAPGETTQTIQVTTLADQITEGSENYVVNLTNIVGAVPVDPTGVGTILDDDGVVFSISGSTQVIEGEIATYTVGYEGVLAPGQTASVVVATAIAAGGNPDATPPSPPSPFADYIALSEGLATGVSFNPTTGVLTFTGGVGNATSLDFTVTTVSDAQIEPTEDYQVQLSGPSANASLGNDTVVTNITNDDRVTFNITGTAAVLEDSTASYTVTYSGDLAPGVTASVHVGTAIATDGNPDATPVVDFDNFQAGAGVSFDAGTGILTFTGGGATSAGFTVFAKPDGDVEPTEDYQVQLSGPSANAELGNAAVVTNIIDSSQVLFSISGPSEVTEGDIPTYTVSYEGTLGDGLTASVQIATADFTGGNPNATFSSDYLALVAGSATGVSFNETTGVITFTGGAGNGTSLTFTVTTVDDTIDEPTEDYQVQLSNASVNAAIGTGAVVTNILDNDLPPTLSINDVTVDEGGIATFTVSLSAASGQTVTVDFATANGTALAGDTLDYDANSGTVTFAPGVTTQTVTVDTNQDLIDEPNETFLVNLTNAGNATIADNQGVGTIVDDDAPPSLTINDITVSEGGIATFTVSLSSASGQTVTVDFATADGTALAGDDLDYDSNNGTLTFAAGVTTQTVTVQTNQDLIDEPNETFVVNLTNASNATIADNQGVGTIIDDDAPPSLTIDDVSVDEGGIATFTVSLSAASGQTVTVDFATANGTALAGDNLDYDANSGTLTFAPGVTTQTIQVDTNSDFVDEDDETFLVNLTNASNATIADNQGLGTIIDGGYLPPAGTASSPTGPLAATFVDVSVQYSPLGSTLVGNYLLNVNVDGQEVDPALVNGVDTQNLTLSVDADVSVQFVREIAGYRNMVGWYTFDANGQIDTDSVHFIWTDASAVSSANYAALITTDFLGNNQLETVQLGTIDAGTRIGFFLIGDGAGYEDNRDLLLDVVGGANAGGYDSDLAAINAVTGYAVDANGNGHITVNGDALLGATYFTHNMTLNSDFNAPDDIAHSLSGLSSANDGYLYIGWEDYPQGGDLDYNDVVFRVDIGDYNLSSASGVVWDPVITLTDPDSVNLTKLLITTTGFQTGDTLTIPGMAGFTIGSDTDASANYSVLITGLHTVADYQTLADGIYFTLATASPVEGQRTIQLAVTDDTNPVGLDNVDPIVSTFNIVIDQTISTATNGTYNLGGGDDKALLSNLNFTSIDGGSGIDTVQPAQIGLDLDAAALDKIHNIEAIDLTGFGSNTVPLSPQDVLDVTDNGNELTIFGDSEDVVDLQGSWASAGTTLEGGVTFNQYTADVPGGPALLKIEQDVTVS